MANGSRKRSVAGKTQGEPQTATRFVFPQRLREQRKRNATTANKKTTRQQKKREGPKNDSNRGRVLKGRQKRTKNLRFRAKKHEPNPRSRKNESQNPKAESKIWEAKDRRGGGAHGPPRDLQRSILRVLDTEETRSLPRLGNRPQDSSALKYTEMYLTP